MRKEMKPGEVSRQYAAAYAMHYTKHDLPLALQLYRQLMASHPDDQEAEYCAVQIQNIANTVVPKHQLLDAQIKLVLAHFERNNTPNAASE